MPARKREAGHITSVYNDLINLFDNFMRQLEHEGYLHDDVPTRFSVWRNFQDLARDVDSIYNALLRNADEDAEDEKRHIESKAETVQDNIEKIAADIEKHVEDFPRPHKAFVLDVAKRLRALAE